MLIKLGYASPMDAAKEQPEDGELAVVTPRRYSKAQHKVNVFPFEVKRDSGEIADQGYITLNVRTGKLTIEHRLAEVPF